MVKEEKNIDFYTTGREPSAEDFARISEWIKKSKNAKLNPDEKRKNRELPKHKAANSAIKSMV